jgi:hypothetical protein
MNNMKTFVWADSGYPSFEYQFVIAMAENIEEARELIKRKIE